MNRASILAVGLTLLTAFSCARGNKPEEDQASQCVAQAIAMDLSLHPPSSNGDGPVPAGCEVVMLPGMRITATTSTGTITITAGMRLKRSYTWEGATRSVEMWADGSGGLSFPGDGYHWQEHHGIARGVLDEGQQHFKTVEEAIKWVDKQRQALTWFKEDGQVPLVYRNDGLLVVWYKVPERKELDVQVWQLYIGGAKPTTLPGSQDNKIIVQEADRKH